MKIELLEVSGWKPALKGMRNPMESWDKSDSDFSNINSDWEPGPNDRKLLLTLTKAGSSHRKVLRFIDVYLDVTSHLKFWDEWATYKFTDSNSTSQMHKLGSRKLTVEDYNTEDFTIQGESLLSSIIDYINKLVVIRKNTDDNSLKEKLFEEMIALNPQGFLYTRTIKMNYETLVKICLERKNHKLKSWREFCVWCRENIPFLEEIMSILEGKDG